MVSIKEALFSAIEKLRDRVAYPTRDAASLLSHVLGKGLEYPYIHPDDPLAPRELESFQGLVGRRSQGEPMAYIKGYKEFMGLTFKADKRALIPRPETEILAEVAVEILSRKWETPDEHHEPSEGYKNEVLKKCDCTPKQVNRVLFADIGCGSGAIGLSILKLVPNAQGVLTDLSPQALSLAKENAKALEVQDRAMFFCGDLFEPIKIHLCRMRNQFGGLSQEGAEPSPFPDFRVFDAIVSNPPYVKKDDYTHLDKEILSYEPAMALLGGESGLDIIERLIDQAPFYLKPSGHLLVEIGYDQAQSVRRLFERKTEKVGRPWRDFWSIRDYAGYQRVFVGQIDI